MKNENLISERIKKDLCPICGEKVTKESVLILDQHGESCFVCNTHNLKIIEKVEE